MESTENNFWAELIFYVFPIASGCTTAVKLAVCGQPAIHFLWCENLETP
jgi:hypothetical protein